MDLGHLDKAAVFVELPGGLAHHKKLLFHNDKAFVNGFTVMFKLSANLAQVSSCALGCATVLSNWVTLLIILPKNLMKKYLDHLVIFISASVLLFSFYQTNGLVSSHFTHIDDIGVANTLINMKLCETLDEKREKYSSMPVIKAIYEKITADPNTCELLNSIYSYVAVPAHWTYAPFQFFFTKLSLSTLNTNSYEAIKYAGRLPSFIFYILGLLAFVYLFASRKYLDYKNPVLIAALALLLGMSLELRIYASQMESYAIGVLSGVLIFGATLSIYKNETYTFKEIFTRASVMSIGIGMQYQGVFLAFSCILALIIVDFRCLGIKKAAKRCISLISLNIILGLYYLPFLIKNFGRGTHHYNAGPTNQYIVTGHSYYERFVDLVRLFSEHTFYNIYTISTSIQTESFFTLGLGFLLTLLLILGLVVLYINRQNPESLLIFLVLFIYILTIVVLVFFGALSFSPTRHSLYHLFPLLLGISAGLRWITSKFSRSWIQLSIFLTSLVIALTSLLLFNSFSIQRNDPLSQKLMRQYFSLLNTELIIGDAIELAFFDTTKDKFIEVNERAPCDKFRLAVTGKEVLQLGIYTKQNSSKLTNEIYTGEFLTGFAKSCGFVFNHISVTDIQRVFSFESLQQIDISAKTQNVGNTVYLYSAKLHIEHF
jgi:hypothetical protein